jgi:prepilin-type N-terminal cleavage/methylation domain-containing protein
MKKHKAFTLIEMLVSAAILSLLVGMILPSLSTARQRAKRVACQSNLRQINLAMWNYSIGAEGRVPYIETPMTNGGGMSSSGRAVGFGQANADDALLDPFNPAFWPYSMPNVLLKYYLGNEPRVFVCPAATLGWPRKDGPYRFTYRDAGANQTSGAVNPPGSYLRENFGFLDGRQLETISTFLTGDPMVDSQTYAKLRGTYVRDLVVREGEKLIGPHEGGTNVITRNFDVEFRNRRETNEDLGGPAGGVRF